VEVKQPQFRTWMQYRPAPQSALEVQSWHLAAIPPFKHKCLPSTSTTHRQPNGPQNSRLSQSYTPSPGHSVGARVWGAVAGGIVGGAVGGAVGGDVVGGAVGGDVEIARGAAVVRRGGFVVFGHFIPPLPMPIPLSMPIAMYFILRARALVRSPSPMLAAMGRPPGPASRRLLAFPSVPPPPVPAAPTASSLQATASPASRVDSKWRGQQAKKGSSDASLSSWRWLGPF
jgi:hypothetical protein